MPNHITNVVKIRGDKKLVAKLLNSIKSDECEFIDFNKIIPMPDELRHVTAPVQIVTDEVREKQLKDMQKFLKSDAARRGGFPPTLGLTSEMQSEYVDRFGADNWYDWSVANWGTKWNAYSQFQTDDNVIQFDTAWAMPDKIFRALSAQYPRLKFEVMYADEDIGNNCGHVIYQDGEIIGDIELDDPVAFAENVKGF